MQELSCYSAVDLVLNQWTHSIWFESSSRLIGSQAARMEQAAKFSRLNLSLPDRHRASLLGTAPALDISFCGLYSCVSNDAVRVAVDLRLEVRLCESLGSYMCSCGAKVDPEGTPAVGVLADQLGTTHSMICGEQLSAPTDRQSRNHDMQCVLNVQMKSARMN